MDRVLRLGGLHARFREGHCCGDGGNRLCGRVPGRCRRRGSVRIGVAGRLGSGRDVDCPGRPRGRSGCRPGDRHGLRSGSERTLRGRDQRREVQREGRLGMRGGGQGQGRQRPPRGRYRQATDTVYVVNGTSDTVSLVDGARCDARVTRGCGPAGGDGQGRQVPGRRGVNPATRTLYVANLGTRQRLGDQRGQVQCA